MPGPIVSLNEESLKSDLRELVRRTVEDTLNGLLEEEADDLVGAKRYERTAEREVSVSTIICPDSQSVWDTFTTGKSPASRFRYDDRISACRSL